MNHPRITTTLKRFTKGEIHIKKFMKELKRKKLHNGNCIIEIQALPILEEKRVGYDNDKM